MDLKGDSSQAKKAIGVQSVVDNKLFKQLLKLPPKQEEVRTDIVELLRRNEKSQALSKLKELKKEEKKNVLETQTKKAIKGEKELLAKLKDVDTAKLQDDAETKKTLEKLRKEYEDVRDDIVTAHFIKDPDDSTKEVSPDLKKQEDELKNEINKLEKQLEPLEIRLKFPPLGLPPAPLLQQQPQQ